MWLMPQAEAPDDYVVASGETHNVRNFVEVAFSNLGLDHRKYVQNDPQLFRPTEKVPLCGNPAKAVAKLGWSRTLSFNEIIRTMIDAEMAFRREREL